MVHDAMSRFGKRRDWTSLLVALFAGVGFFLLTSNAPPTSASPLNGGNPAATPNSSSLTPGPNAMTIYSVTNPYPTTLSVQNVFTDTTGFNYSFFDQIPPLTTNTYHISSMPQIPLQFNGVLSLYAAEPVISQIVGYDYSGSVTPAPSPIATLSPATSATVSPSVTPTITSSPSATATVAAPPSATPTTSPTNISSAVLYSDGFEESSFAAGGWTLNAGGVGTAAQLVTNPVWSGSQAASFSTQTEMQGQHAFANANFTWPTSNVVTGQTMLQLENTSIQYVTQVFGLETRGPNPWTTRAGFFLEPTTWGIIYTTLDGTVHDVDTSQPYQTGQWYNLAVTVDDRGMVPVFTFSVNGQVITTVTDTSSGTDTDPPVVVDVGFGPGWWGRNSGTALADNVVVTDVSYSTSVASSTSTATVTSTPTASAASTYPPTATPVITSTATATAVNTIGPTATMRSTRTPRRRSTPGLDPFSNGDQPNLDDAE